MKEIRQKENSLRVAHGEIPHHLADEQREELENLKSQIPNPDSINFFDWYRKDDRFRNTYHTAMGYALLPSLNRMGNLENNFAGHTFEEIAYIFCALKETRDGVTVLSPERTNQFFKYLYPNAPRVKFPFREDSLGGDSTAPDGIGIDELDPTNNTVRNIYEYTLSGKEDEFREKYTFFRERKHKFPQVFANASLVFVVPKSLRMPEVTASDIRFIETTFTRHDFRNFMLDVYDTYKVSEDTATLKQIEEWRIMQPSGDLEKMKIDSTWRHFFAGMNESLH